MLSDQRLEDSGENLLCGDALLLRDIELALRLGLPLASLDEALVRAARGEGLAVIGDRWRDSLELRGIRVKWD